MFDLEIGQQPNSVGGGFQPITKLDILDRWSRVGLIVTTHLQKYLAANRPARAPKSRRFAGAVLMDEMVEQIFKLGMKIPFIRLVIVRANHRRHIFLLR